MDGRFRPRVDTNTLMGRIRSEIQAGNPEAARALRQRRRKAIQAMQAVAPEFRRPADDRSEEATRERVGQ
jgi:hypothetical protein